MKKYSTLLFLTILLCIFPNGKNSSQLQTGKPALFEEDNGDEITLNKLNCKPGLYRTYEDFKKGNPENFQFIDNGSKGIGNAFTFLGFFKDANGKTVKMTYDDFWGFKCESGLFRCYRVTTSNNGAPKYGAGRVVYVATDHVVYHTEPAANVFDGYSRVSKDLKSEVLSNVEFEKKVKSHYKEMGDYASKTCPRPKGERPPAAYMGLQDYYIGNPSSSIAQKKRECLISTPNLKFILNYYIKGIGNEYIAAKGK